MHALFLLRGGLLQHIGEVVFQQRLLQALFAGGIDALADQQRLCPEKDGLRAGGNDSLLLFNNRQGGKPLQPFGKGADMRGRGAAAAAEDPCALTRKLYLGLREGIRVNVIDGGAVYHPGKAGIGLHQHRNGGVGQVFPDDRRETVRTHGAVDADGVRPHALQQGDHSGRLRAGKQAAVFAVGIGYEDRQAAVFLHREQRGLRLHGIVHGLDKKEIRAVFHAEAGQQGIAFHRVLKGKVAQRLQKLAGGSKVQRHKGRMVCAGLLRLPGAGDTGGDQRLRFLRGVVQRIDAEGVRDHDVGTGCHVGGVQLHDLLRAGQAPGFGPFPALQPGGLQHGPCAAVQQHEVIPHIFQYIHGFFLRNVYPSISERFFRMLAATSGLFIVYTWTFLTPLAYRSMIWSVA